MKKNNRRVRLALGTRRSRYKLELRRLSAAADLSFRKFVELSIDRPITDRSWWFFNKVMEPNFNPHREPELKQTAKVHKVPCSFYPNDGGFFVDEVFAPGFCGRFQKEA